MCRDFPAMSRGGRPHSSTIYRTQTMSQVCNCLPMYWPALSYKNQMQFIRAETGLNFCHELDLMEPPMIR